MVAPVVWKPHCWLTEALQPFAQMQTAGAFALSYKALLNKSNAHGGTRIWQSYMLRERAVSAAASCTIPRGLVADRAPDIVIAGDDGKGNLRRFGRTNVPQASGLRRANRMGLWRAGLSFAYRSNGYYRKRPARDASPRRSMQPGRRLVRLRRYR